MPRARGEWSRRCDATCTYYWSHRHSRFSICGMCFHIYDIDRIVVPIAVLIADIPIVHLLLCHSINAGV
jgi:hypothetical protein